MAERDGTRWGAVLLALAAALLGGCADLRLYSPALDEQGKKAQKAWADVDLPGIVQAERERSAALLKAEVAYMQSQPLLSMDLELYELVVGETTVSSQGAVVAPGLKSRVARRFQETVGDGKFYNDLKLAREREVRAQRRYADGATEVRRLGLEPPPCKSVLSGKSDELGKDLQSPLNSMAKGALTLLKEACTPSAASVPEDRRSEPNAVSNLLTCSKKPAAERAACLAGMPRLQRELEELAALEGAMEAERSAQLNERNSVRIASANYKKVAASAEGKEAAPADTPLPECTAKPVAATGATAAATPAAPASAASAPVAGPNRTKVTVALERLKCAVGKLTGDNKYSLKLLSEERLSAVNEALDALLSPKAAGAAGETAKDRAGRALQRLADTADGWDKAKASAEDVLQRPLVAQQEIEQLQQAALNRAIGIDASEIELQRIRAKLTERQADHYKAAEGALSSVTLSEGGLEPVFLAATPLPANERARVIEGVAHYGYAIGYLQGQYQGTKLQQQALVTARQLDLAENSLNQWDTLIRANVDMLAEWAAVGVKEETIARFVNAILLLWIGHGTNNP